MLKEIVFLLSIILAAACSMVLAAMADAGQPTWVFIVIATVTFVFFLVAMASAEVDDETRAADIVHAIRNALSHKEQ